MKRVAAIVPILFALVPQTAQAELLRACTETGNCGVCDIVATAVTLGKWLITGSAGLALVVIVWASIGFATSAGNPDKIGAAKKQILGAVLGVGIVFAAFYLVFWVILAFANPTEQFRFSEDPAARDKVARSTGLVDFLGGTAWWNLCNEADLRKNSDSPGSVKNETADCKYWGDNTSCSENSNKVCCSGTCQNAPCVPNPGVAAYIGTQAAGDEAAIRTQFSVGGVQVNKTPCTDIYTSTDCTSVAGLSLETVNKLIQASNSCGGCIVITGGTERGGHSPNTSHGSPNVVDVRNSPEARSALESLGVRNTTTFNQPNTYVCDTDGRAVSCDTTSHLHTTF